MVGAHAMTSIAGHATLGIDRISVEPSRACSKGCSFCYNGSGPSGDGDWRVAELVAFAIDCARNGVRSISFGGGEPLEFPGIFDALVALEGVLARTLTTNGLLLDPAAVDALVRARLEKVHVSIHAPENAREVTRVIAQARELEARGVRSGVNLLVRASRLQDARAAARRLRDAGIGNDRIVYLPMRGSDTPTARDVAAVAHGPFQSMTCLGACGKSPRFASIGADRTAAWCSYTRARRRLARPDHASLIDALNGLGLEDCSGGRLVALARNREKLTPSSSAER
jgi:sulfatase maturation enzyme AslB (radical SAM superfamily)